MSIYKERVFPFLTRLDAESVHNSTLQLLRVSERYPVFRQFLERIYSYENPKLNVRLWGLNFENPLGLAAGFDKNAVVPESIGTLGFGHVEVGTVTPLPQKGNRRPRIFRLPDDKAVINRMGFPGDGVVVAKQNLRKIVNRELVLGVNAGVNKESVDEGKAVDDYVRVVKELYPYADYVVVNVSSPNTARLRELQGKEALGALLDPVLAVRDQMSVWKPVLVKIAPDFDNPEQEIDDMLEVITSREVDGVIATNTTVSREGLKSSHRGEAGGLSGRPLKDRSTEIVKYIYQRTEGGLPIIGVGGVFNADDAAEKIRAGASLVQVYTGFIYEGPGYARNLNMGLVAYIERDNLENISEIRGADVSR